jgi:hypothetical protein
VEEPAARLYLCATKCDLLAPSGHGQGAPRIAQHAERVPELDVSVEYWGAAATQHRHQLQPVPQQQQQQGLPSAAEPPADQGSRHGPAGAAPTTPARSERAAQSPVDDSAQGGAKEEARAAEAPPEAAAAGQGAATDEAATLRSPFAALATLPAAGSAAPSPRARSSPKAAQSDRAVSSGSAGSPLAVSEALSPMSPTARSSPSQAEWQALSQRQPPSAGEAAAAAQAAQGGRDLKSSQHQQQEQQHSRHDTFAANQHQPEWHVVLAPGTSIDPAAERSLPLRQPKKELAVPEAAVERYCTANGLRMFWVSARTGKLGVTLCVPRVPASRMTGAAPCTQQQQQQWQQPSAL